MSSGKVSVSIVNFNGKHLLGGCLDSVFSQTLAPFEVVLVDNASRDGSVDFVRKRYPQVRIIENPENLMFSAGQNQGIRATAGEYVLALNTDVTLRRDFLAHAVHAAEADAKTGSVSGKIFRADGKTLDTTGLSLGRSRKPIERGYGEPDRGLYDSPGYVFGAGGACPLYRRSMLEAIKEGDEYFDERFGAFYEDLDLAWRAYSGGWKAYYEPKSVAFHERGGTAKVQDSPLYFLRGYNFTRLSAPMRARLLLNRWMTIIKNDKPLDFIINLPWILLYDIKVWAYMIFFSFGSVPEFVRKTGDLRYAWRKRKIFKMRGGN